MNDDDKELWVEENNRLRELLEWCAERLSEADHIELEKLTQTPLPLDGGTDDEERADWTTVRMLLNTLDELVRPLVTATQLPTNILWFKRLDMLLDRLGEFQPKRPLYSRVDELPNVYRPVPMHLKD